MLKLADSEKLMYDVMSALVNDGIPVIYRGALIR